MPGFPGIPPMNGQGPKDRPPSSASPPCSSLSVPRQPLQPPTRVPIMRNSFESPLWGLLPLLALSAACFSPLKAQVGFSVTNLPNQLGDYHRAYVASDGV